MIPGILSNAWNSHHVRAARASAYEPDLWKAGGQPIAVQTNHIVAALVVLLSWQSLWIRRIPS